MGHKFALGGSSRGALYFDEGGVPDAQRLPGVKGLKGPLSCLTQARYGIAWGVIGAAQACLAQLIEYTGTRELFGRALSRNQAIQVRLAERARGITTPQMHGLHLGRPNNPHPLPPLADPLAKATNFRVCS